MTTLIRCAWRSMRLTSRAGFKLTIACLVALAVTAASAHASGVPDPVMKLKEKVDISSVGDGQFTVDVKLPTRFYTALKIATPNTALLLRKMGLGGQSYLQVEGVHGDWDDGSNTVSIHWRTRGLAHVGSDGLWQTELGSGFEMIVARDNFAVFNGAMSTKIGLATAVIEVSLPRGSSELQLLRSPERFAWHLPKPATSAGSRPGLDVQFEARPQVMTCLAKLYSNATFNKLWVGRSVVRNTGTQTLRDFRIRFHVADYSTGWGPWQSCEYVVPGETVVNAYFPIFDLNKVAQLNGTSPATLEMEYEYRQADGRTIHSSDARTIQLLGHNEVLYSNIPTDEAVTWQDRFNLGPVILAAFVTYNDPIIQEVAGTVSRQVHGVAASAHDKDAIRFLQGLYEFMAYNRIAYQTPPDNVIEGQICQHVKYGRDVLRNRAGTCIDLAILYGSACEAVGLHPVLVLIPGHCFPAVRLPESHKLIGVETTMVGRYSFVDATKKGLQEIKAAEQDKRFLVSDVVKLQGQGVHGLELPPLSSTALKDWGYHAVPEQTQTVASQSNGSGERSPSLAGTWVFRGRINGVYYNYVAVLGSNGRFADRVQVTDQTGTTATVETTGSFRATPQAIISTSDSGVRHVFYYAFQNNGTLLQVYMDEVHCWVPFNRQG